MHNEKANRGLMAAFSGLIDTQVWIGISYILWSDFAWAGFPRYRFDYAVTMIIAAGLAHMSTRWRKSDVQIRVLIVGVLITVFMGVSLLP